MGADVAVGVAEVLFPVTVNEITDRIIGAAIEVHRTLGPGLLESTYATCLCHEFSLRGLAFVREHPLPIAYKGLSLESGYTYLRMGGWKAGLLINFNVPILVNGVRRKVLELDE